MDYRKEYVDISLFAAKDGTTRPIQIRVGEKTYKIQQVLAVHRNTASHRVGGIGTRYTVMINGRQAHLFDENGRWFVEKEI